MMSCIHTAAELTPSLTRGMIVRNYDRQQCG